GERELRAGRAGLDGEGAGHDVDVVADVGPRCAARVRARVEVADRQEAAARAVRGARGGDAAGRGDRDRAATDVHGGRRGGRAAVRGLADEGVDDAARVRVDLQEATGDRADVGRVGRRGRGRRAGRGDVDGARGDVRA